MDFSFDYFLERGINQRRTPPPATKSCPDQFQRTWWSSSEENLSAAASSALLIPHSSSSSAAVVVIRTNQITCGTRSPRISIDPGDDQYSAASCVIYSVQRPILLGRPSLLYPTTTTSSSSHQVCLYWIYIVPSRPYWISRPMACAKNFSHSIDHISRQRDIGDNFIVVAAVRPSVRQ